MRKKKVMALLLALLMTLSVLGCGSQEVSQESKPEAVVENETPTEKEPIVEEESVDLSEHVDLKWFAPLSHSADEAKVFAEANKIYEDKLNCNVEFNYIPDFGTYASNMNLMIAAQEEFDICYTDNWSLYYPDAVAQGAFLDITDMLPEVAPELWAAIPEAAWDAVRVNGRIYGIPNQQQWARSGGFLFNAKYYDEYDGDSVVDVNTLTDYILRVSEGEAAKGNTWVGQASNTDWLFQYCQISGWEIIGATNVPGRADGTQEHPEVFNEYKTDAFKEIIQAKAKLYEAGCIPSDILTAPAYSYPGDALIANFENLGMSTEAEWTASRPAWEGVVMRRPGFSMLTSTGVTSTMTAISATSKNPERALLAYQEMFLNSELFNLVTIGIEGEHYTIDEQGRYTLVENAQYTAPNANWVMGNTFNGLVPSHQEPERWERTMEWNNSAKASTLLGFSYDPSNVSTENANCQAVVAEYYPLFMAGTYGADVMKYYDEFIEKLDAAGADVVIAEKQAQIDEFLANK